MQPKKRVGKQLRGARGVPSWSSSDVWLQSEQAASGRARKRFRIFQQPLVTAVWKMIPVLEYL